MGTDNTTGKAVSTADAPQQTLTDHVSEQLAAAIVSGELAPGTKLNQPELARRFGTSRGPLREAIERLEAKGLVTRTAHVGARVATLSREILIEMYLVREALEGMAARLSAERMEDSEIEGLERLLDESMENINTNGVHDPVDHDWDFHYRLAIGSRSEMIKRVLCDDFYQLLKLYRSQHRYNSGRAERAMEEHRRVVAAIKDRDAEMAEFMMRRHIATARSVLQSSIVRHEREKQEPDTALQADEPSNRQK